MLWPDAISSPKTTSGGRGAAVDGAGFTSRRKRVTSAFDR